ncbi:MAG: hypothetical protein A4E65_02296 [Syntrophorhabdus sp. PtaU1.Bin153]|nr:MAG: hypothetical protein A4E65_02296 [Syntrophorhabdus sp. PtaU1.Bin153]
MDTWDLIKQKGSEHYKTGGIEPIDLFRDIKPHPTHTALTVKALTDTIKYAYRMLSRGVNHQDCDKITHYVDMCRWAREHQEAPQKDPVT